MKENFCFGGFCLLLTLRSVWASGMQLGGEWGASSVKLSFKSAPWPSLRFSCCGLLDSRHYDLLLVVFGYSASAEQLQPVQWLLRHYGGHVWTCEWESPIFWLFWLSKKKQLETDYSHNIEYWWRQQWYVGRAGVEDEEVSEWGCTSRPAGYGRQGGFQIRFRRNNTTKKFIFV